MTREEAIAKHRKMWNWIAEETIKQKRKVSKMEYFKHFNFKSEDIPFCGCYCCEYAVTNGIGCEYCPVKWSHQYKSCGSEFIYWNRIPDTDWAEAAKYAEIIANLPERKIDA